MNLIHEEFDMGRLLILPKELAIDEMEMPGLDNGSLPFCYMSDYSILALQVDNYNAAQSLLEEEQQLEKTAVGLNVVVDGITGLQNILRLFETHGIEAAFTDIAAQIYQG
jgi:hypothetical protein